MRAFVLRLVRRTKQVAKTEVKITKQTLKNPQVQNHQSDCLK